jgi:hypothetical protein
MASSPPPDLVPSGAKIRVTQRPVRTPAPKPPALGKATRSSTPSEPELPIANRKRGANR